MKFLTTFKINNGFDRWLKLVDDLQPYMDKYEYKMMFACTNDDETQVWDMGEANNADLVNDFLNDQEVINMRKEAGVDIESSVVLSMITKHKIEMPICESVYRALYNNSNPISEVDKLMKRNLKSKTF